MLNKQIWQTVSFRRVECFVQLNCNCFLLVYFFYYSRNNAIFFLILYPILSVDDRRRLQSTVQCLSAMNCWLKCMMLDPYNQTDHPECKSRPDSGLSAITELDPGYITGNFFQFLMHTYMWIHVYIYIFTSELLILRPSFISVERMD